MGDAFGRGSQAARNLKGRFAIGHNRYSTAGGSRLSNIQPIFADLAGGGLAIVFAASAGWRRWALPLVIVSQAIPVIALAPGQGCRIVDARIKVRAAR